ncbi:MAG: methyltransferase domain-containing protein [Clostridia bacterium]|nr:methyltransferase domain-containing protein [Clostridia bacterium]
MAQDFRSARFWAAALIEPALYPGARAVDATMGNGKDALWLCERVGPEGKVYAFDVQAEAVSRTRSLLEAAGVAERATLFNEGHQRMAALVPEPVDVVMFNLGWLPGAGHGVTTLTRTTLQAADAALSILKPEGLLTICVYPGHDEGARELAALREWAAALDPRRCDAMTKHYMNQPGDPPVLIAVKLKKEKQNRE